MGGWNAYFIGKVILFQIGALNFHAFYNLLLAAALLLPIRAKSLRRLRQAVAIPAGVALLYYDTWYPPISRLLDRPEVLQFSTDYLLDLLGRFIHWDMVGAAFVFLVAYLFISQWVRLTVFSVLALSWLVASDLTGVTLELHLPTATQAVAAAPPASGDAPSVPTASERPAPPPAARSAKPDDTQLDQTLQAFYAAEAARHVEMPKSLKAQAPFDVLFISVCSMATDDLQMSSLMSHPVFRKMDVMFDDFNSATSYSGPALLRLLRADCGQVSHHDLYQTADPRCYLFDNLRALGFQTELALNHDGQFEDFAHTLETVGHLPKAIIPRDLKPRQRAFDGSPIWGDLDTLNRWQNAREKSMAPHVALLYNTVSLHDGNREQLPDGGSHLAPYQGRAQDLLDGLDTFLTRLEHSGRRVLVVLIPEHGANLRGDRMQISGMREIPSPSITRIPVGVRLIGGKSAHDSTVHVSGPTSFLALSELVSRILSTDVFDESQVDWSHLTAGLPHTQAVSENSGDVLLFWNGTPYVRMDKGPWIAYPK